MKSFPTQYGEAHLAFDDVVSFMSAQQNIDNFLRKVAGRVVRSISESFFTTDYGRHLGETRCYRGSDNKKSSEVLYRVKGSSMLRCRVGKKYVTIVISSKWRRRFTIESSANEKPEDQT